MYYFGYKLHAVCSIEGVVESLDITPANVHDIHYLKDIKRHLNDCSLIGDIFLFNVNLTFLKAVTLNLKFL